MEQMNGIEPIVQRWQRRAAPCGTCKKEGGERLVSLSVLQSLACGVASPPPVLHVHPWLGIWELNPADLGSKPSNSPRVSIPIKTIVPPAGIAPAIARLKGGCFAA